MQQNTNDKCTKNENIHTRRSSGVNYIKESWQIKVPKNGGKRNADGTHLAGARYSVSRGGNQLPSSVRLRRGKSPAVLYRD